jgi:hypothetical protein
MRTGIALVAAVALTLGTAQAQDIGAGAGPGRVEIAAFPVGGMFFGHSDNHNPNFGDYALGGAVTVNVTKWIAFEGDLGGGIGIRQDMTVNGVSLTNQKSPHMFAFNGDLVVNVMGRDRELCPYVLAGVGGLRVFTNTEVASLGLVSDETYFTGNVGAGVKWFATRHVGLRGDARLFMVKNKDQAPFFNTDGNQFGGRIYAGVLLTY